MNRLASLLVLAALTAFPAFASIDVTWPFVNFVSEPQAVKGVKVTPLAPWGTNSAGIITGDYKSRQTLNTGAVTITNMTAGYSYRVTFSGSFVETVFTNYFPPGLTGAVNATAYLTPTNPAAFIPYSVAQANSLFALKSNATFYGSLPTVNGVPVSTNSGSGDLGFTNSFMQSMSGYATNPTFVGTADRILSVGTSAFGSFDGFDIDVLEDGTNDLIFNFVRAGARTGSMNFDFGTVIVSGTFGGDGGGLTGIPISGVTGQVATNRMLASTKLENTNSSIFSVDGGIALTVTGESGAALNIAEFKDGNGTLAAWIDPEGALVSKGGLQIASPGVMTGNGSGISALNASSLATGILPDAVSTNSPHTNWTFTSSTFSGDGSGLTNLNASKLVGGPGTNSWAGTGTASLTFTNGGAVNLKDTTNWGTLVSQTNLASGGVSLNAGNATIGNVAVVDTANTLKIRFGTAANAPALRQNGNVLQAVQVNEAADAPFSALRVTVRSSGSIGAAAGTDPAAAAASFWDFPSTGTIRGNTNVSALGTITATTGFITSATNTLAFTTVGFFTNTLGVNATAYFSAGSSAVVTNEFNNVVVSITAPTVIQLHPNWKVSGTTMSATLVAQ